MHIEYEKNNCIQVGTIITIQDIEKQDYLQVKNAFIKLPIFSTAFLNYVFEFKNIC